MLSFKSVCLCAGLLFCHSANSWALPASDIAAPGDGDDRTPEQARAAVTFGREAKKWEFLPVGNVPDISSAARLAAAPPGTADKQVYPGWHGLKYFFVFGDSYTTTGFNLTDGVSALPSPSNPMGNPPWPGWTSANGPNWIGYLTQTFNRTLIQTFNMAYGGATIDTDLVVPWRPDVLSLKQQITDLFIGYLQPRKAEIAPWTSRNALFAVWIGVNDIGRSYYDTRDSWDTFHDTLLAEYFRLIDSLYAQGARNFLFLNVPTIELSPGTLVQGDEAVQLERAALKSFNTKLAAKVKALLKQRKGVWAKVFESSKVFGEILSHPASYGVANTTEYCEVYSNGTPEWDTYDPTCGVPVDEYFWLNSLHPTHTVHKEVARRIAKIL
ncbi:hypothetical protein EDC01DRAFT_138086 [Geopyxis carbonaria]|nr:hypothetical protein EDC01DRAFT_138086 [Geopyxis carbonaria]